MSHISWWGSLTLTPTCRCPASEVERLLHRQVQAAPRRILRRAHAHAGTAAHAVRTVQRIDQRQLRMHLADAVEIEVVRYVEVELEVVRQRATIGYVAVLAQAAAEQVIGPYLGAVVECIGHAAG